MEEGEKIQHATVDDDKFKKVQARVRRMRSFYSSLITFILVNILLLIINLAFSPNNLWFLWVTIIWGAVLILQGFNIFFARDHFLGKDWEDRKIRELMEKEDKNNKLHK